MIKLELDWAGEADPHARANEVGASEWMSEEGVHVEYDGSPGPTGWPIVRVYVEQREHDAPHRAFMRLHGWLEQVYGMEDEGAREELADLAQVV